MKFRWRQRRRSPAAVWTGRLRRAARTRIFIIDSAGIFVHMERMDGEAYNNISTALLKAQTALKTRQPTSIRAAQLRNNPDGLPRSSSFYNFFAVAGGVPIVVDGQLIGAVGVGRRGEQRR